MLAKVADISRLTWGRIHSHTHYMAVGSPQIPTGYWLGDSIFLLLHSAAQDSWLPSEQVNKRRHPRWKSRYLYLNLRIDVSLFCHDGLFIRSKSINPDHLRGWDYARTWIPRGRDHWGGIFESAYPQQHSLENIPEPQSLFFLQSHWLISQLLPMA